MIHVYVCVDAHWFCGGGGINTRETCICLHGLLIVCGGGGHITHCLSIGPRSRTHTNHKGSPHSGGPLSGSPHKHKHSKLIVSACQHNQKHIRQWNAHHRHAQTCQKNTRDPSSSGRSQYCGQPTHALQAPQHSRLWCSKSRFS